MRGSRISLLENNLSLGRMVLRGGGRKVLRITTEAEVFAHAVTQSDPERQKKKKTPFWSHSSSRSQP